MEVTLPRCTCSIRSLLSSQYRGWQQQGRRIATGSPKHARTHYVALGITPTATQADVKAAYYKLTKMYHPDRQRSKEAAGLVEAEEHIKKFREVTAAYEVLGNVKLRKLYDKGMHHGGTASRSTSPAWRAQEDDDPAMKFYRSRDLKSRPPPPTDNTPLYDFDAWSKQHYGATFARDQATKKRQHFRMAAATATSNDIKVERVLIVMGVMVISLLIISSDMTNHDQTTYDRGGGSLEAAANTSTR